LTISSAIAIRSVTLDDLDDLVEIYLAGARHHAAIDPDGFRVPDPADVAVRLRRRVEAIGDDHAYVMALVDAMPAGSATMDIDDPPHPGNMARAVPSAELGIAVLEGFRGQGVGRRLIDHLERWAAARGIQRSTLTVTESNAGAIRLYHELGYTDTGREMRKDLARP
jgi:ribosomal protein S18 acetylase RimI-like enzyme